MSKKSPNRNHVILAVNPRSSHAKQNETDHPRETRRTRPGGAAASCPHRPTWKNDDMIRPFVGPALHSLFQVSMPYLSNCGLGSQRERNSRREAGGVQCDEGRESAGWFGWAGAAQLHSCWVDGGRLAGCGVWGGLGTGFGLCCAMLCVLRCALRCVTSRLGCAPPRVHNSVVVMQGGGDRPVR